MKLYSQKRLSYTSAINKPFIIYCSPLMNPHGYSGIYDIKNWPCREGVVLPKETPMTKEQKEREFKICLMKVEVELSKRKIKTLLDEFVSEAITKAIETV